MRQARVHGPGSTAAGPRAPCPDVEASRRLSPAATSSSARRLDLPKRSTPSRSASRDEPPLSRRTRGARMSAASAVRGSLACLEARGNGWPRPSPPVRRLRTLAPLGPVGPRAAPVGHAGLRAVVRWAARRSARAPKREASDSGTRAVVPLSLSPPLRHPSPRLCLI